MMSRPQGKTIAVTAAAGGVGSLLIQLAKQAGAKEVIALASDPSKLEVTKSFGADRALNYHSQGWINRMKDATSGKGVDIIYDTVGGTYPLEQVAEAHRALENRLTTGKVVLIP